MKKKILLIFILLFIMLNVLVILLIFFYENTYLYVQTQNLSLEVAEKVGINVDTDAIHFGKVYPAGAVWRNVQLKNNFNVPIKAHIIIEGDITPFITVTENDFVLKPDEARNISYHASTKSSTPYGNYTGNTTIFYSRKLFAR